MTAERVAYVLAIWFGCGLVPRAPGTAGTLGALPIYFLAVAGGGPVVVAACAACLAAVGVWAAGRVARKLGTKDPQRVCIDEVAGVLVTLAAAPPVSAWRGTGASSVGSLAWVLAGVALFRVFDVLKPWPARLCERRLPGGWGIVGDDVVAGLWGAATLLAMRALMGAGS